MKENNKEQKIHEYLCEIVDNEELNWAFDIEDEKLFKNHK